MQATIRTLLTLSLSALLLCTLVAQQPPGKTSTAPQPPSKTPPPPDKTAPGKTTMPPDKTAPGKTNTPPAKNAATASVEPLVTYTFDGVRIDGDYYPVPETKGKTAPCIILVHAVGLKNVNASRADWGKLPAKLQSQGYAVAAIDLRGYGKSKTVEELFWKTHRPKTRNRDTIEAKDHSSPIEMLEMVYDLTAVKIWLNTKNNSKECNSKAIAVIGLEQGGLIALAWAANEHSDPNRTKQKPTLNTNQGGFGNPGVGNPGFGNPGVGNPAFGNPNFNNPNLNNPNYNPNNQGMNNSQGSGVARFEGEDIVCVIPISTTAKLNEPLSMGLIERWITFTRDRQVGLMAIYGAQDKDANTFWTKAGTWAKPAGDKFRFKNSGTKPVKGTSLVGAKLLSNDTLDVPKTLEDYLSDALKRAAESRLWSEQQGQDRPTQIDIQRLLR
jgi:predicted esterase